MPISIKFEPDQVIFEERLGVRKVILNRPDKLNSLKHEMICQMLRKLKAYENDPTVRLVILKGNGKAFCAGGDVVAAVCYITEGHWSFGASFYRKQLTLDYLLGTYKKPVVALLNGIVMGGGAGISMHATYRIVTENTVPAYFLALLSSIYIQLAGIALVASHVNYYWPGFPSKMIGDAFKKLPSADQWILRIGHYLPWLFSLWMNQKLFPVFQLYNDTTDVFSRTDLDVLKMLADVPRVHEEKITQQGFHYSLYKDLLAGHGNWGFGPMDVFAMPEVSIGVCPDVGASNFLSRLPGFLGEYLGLTGAKLDGSSMVACGLATHFVLSKDIASLENALDIVAASDDISDEPTITEVINQYAHHSNLVQNSIYSRLNIINKCFSGETVEQILSSLEGSITGSETDNWISSAVNSMKRASPLCLKVFLKLVRDGRGQELDQCLSREFNVTCHIIRGTFSHDFFEGTRAMLIDKDKNPQWKPEKLELVTKEMVDKYLSNVEDEEWEPLKLPSRSNQSYPMISRL